MAEKLSHFETTAFDLLICYSLRWLMVWMTMLAAALIVGRSLCCRPVTVTPCLSGRIAVGVSFPVGWMAHWPCCVTVPLSFCVSCFFCLVFGLTRRGLWSGMQIVLGLLCGCVVEFVGVVQVRLGVVSMER